MGAIANRVKVDIKVKGDYQTYDLSREENGVWTATVKGDLELASYVYLVKVNGTWNEATDPYAIASTPNHKRTVIVDPEKLKLTLIARWHQKYSHIPMQLFMKCTFVTSQFIKIQELKMWVNS